MSDLRKESRKKLIAFTPAYIASPRQLLGYIADLTLNGAMIVGEKHAEVNVETKLAIEFPSDLPASKIVIPSRIAWSRQDESPAYFNIGVEFSEVTENNAAVIRAVLERYQFGNPNTAVN